MKQANGKVTATVNNSTEAESASASLTEAPSFTSIQAETQVCCSTGGPISPIPSFTPIKFGALKFNGATLSTMSPAEVEMYDGATLQVATSPISSIGTFSNIFKHA